MPSRFTKSIKASLIAGLLVFLPAFLTVWLLWKLFLLVDGFLNETVRHVLWAVLKIQFFRTHDIPGLGFVAVVVILFLAGLIARNFIGRKIIDITNRLVARIPLANKIYTAIDQIAKAFLSGQREVFQKAVLIEYPHKGMYCIAFYTQDTQGPVQESLPTDVISVFLPSTPNPTTGFLLFVPKSEVIPLDMPVEEALKLIISAGAIVPASQQAVWTPPHQAEQKPPDTHQVPTSGSDAP
jgi:uncharacterized membrane protein